MYDFHIHMRNIQWDKDLVMDFKKRTLAAGVDGGALFSPSPYSCEAAGKTPDLWKIKLDSVLNLSSEIPEFLPVFYFDPLAPDAEEQILTAAERGIKAFKIICMNFYPKDILPQLRVIVKTGLPVIFHSGILYSVKPAGEFNRPINFEYLLEIPCLKFSLAHMSWPWTAELVSVFGEQTHFSRCAPEKTGIMYTDLTPGTPAVFRRNALREYFLTGYSQIENRTVWGSDCIFENYDPDYSAKVQNKDRQYITEIIKDAGEYEIAASRYADLFERISAGNFKSFFNIDPLS